MRNICRPSKCVMAMLSVCYLIPMLRLLSTSFFFIISLHLPSTLSVALHYLIPLLTLGMPPSPFSPSSRLFSCPCIIDSRLFLSKCVHLIFCPRPDVLNVTPSPHPRLFLCYINWSKAPAAWRTAAASIREHSVMTRTKPAASCAARL